MQIDRAEIPDVLIIRPKKFGDVRGFFSEVFKNADLKAHGVDLDWMQDNHSFSQSRGVLRGLHYQAAPEAQAKILRVIRGAIYDVAVDIRRGSPTYGRHVAIELSEANWSQLFVPVGFAHGFCTLTENVEVIYKVSSPYAPACEGGLMWDDPEIGINWPAREVTLADRDRKWPPFKGFVSPFSV
jgi:dTDP-4-dehydrorhamnose 3,5-epimerase